MPTREELIERTLKCDQEMTFMIDMMRKYAHALDVQRALMLRGIPEDDPMCCFAMPSDDYRKCIEHGFDNLVGLRLVPS